MENPSVPSPDKKQRDEKGRLLPGVQIAKGHFKFTPQELKEKLCNYFKECQEQDKIPTIINMCLAIDTTRETIREYLQNPLFVDEIKKAKERICGEWEQKALRNKINPIFTMFLLKNHYGYTDVRHVEQHTQAVSVNITAKTEDLKLDKKRINAINALLSVIPPQDEDVQEQE